MGTIHGTCSLPSRNRRTQRFAYLEVVCLLIVAVVVIVREGGPPDQGRDLWTGKEFERGPEKAAFDAHLHPQGHGQQLLALPALLRVPNHSTLFLIFQPQFLGEHSVRTPELFSVPCGAREAGAVRFGEPQRTLGSRFEAAASVLSAEAWGM